MFNWLWKRLGYHVCEEFTQWETHKVTFSRLTDYKRDGMIALRVDRVKYTKRWQERPCTICGRIEQHELEQ